MKNNGNMRYVGCLTTHLNISEMVYLVEWSNLVVTCRSSSVTRAQVSVMSVQWRISRQMAMMQNVM